MVVANRPPQDRLVAGHHLDRHRPLVRKLAADLQSGDLARVTGAIKAPKGVVLNADFVALMHNAKITVKPDSVSSKGTAGQVIYIVTPDLAGKTHEWATTMEYTKMYHPRVRGALKARWDEVHEVEAVGATADTVRLLDLDARAAGTHQLGVHGEVGGGETGHRDAVGIGDGHYERKPPTVPGRGEIDVARTLGGAGRRRTLRLDHQQRHDRLRRHLTRASVMRCALVMDAAAGRAYYPALRMIASTRCRD